MHGLNLMLVVGGPAPAGSEWDEWNEWDEWDEWDELALVFRVAS